MLHPKITFHGNVQHYIILIFEKLPHFYSDKYLRTNNGTFYAKISFQCFLISRKYNISQLNSGFYFVTHGNMNSISWIHFKLRNEILFAELWPKTRISNKIWPMLTLRRAGGVSGTRRVEWMKTTHVSGYWTVIQSIWFDQGGGFFHATGHVL